MTAASEPLTRAALRPFFADGAMGRVLLPLPSHNCIYVKNAKAGCSTVTLLLERIHTREHDYAPGHILDLHRAHRLPRPKEVGWDRLLDMLSGSAFRFTFVREPLARAESAWRDKLQSPRDFDVPILLEAQRSLGLPEDPASPLPFERFVDLLESQDPRTEMDRHWRPQHLNLMHPVVEYDMTGRLENFDRDWAILTDRLGLPAVTPEVVNTRARDRASVYDGRSDLVARVQAVYATDIELYGY